jgi:hypothetical protein
LTFGDCLLVEFHRRLNLGMPERGLQVLEVAFVEGSKRHARHIRYVRSGIPAEDRASFRIARMVGSPGRCSAPLSPANYADNGLLAAHSSNSARKLAVMGRFGSYGPWCRRPSARRRSRQYRALPARDRPFSTPAVVRCGNPSATGYDRSTGSGRTCTRRSAARPLHRVSAFLGLGAPRQGYLAGRLDSDVAVLDSLLEIARESESSPFRWWVWFCRHPPFCPECPRRQT